MIRHQLMFRVVSPWPTEDDCTGDGYDEPFQIPECEWVTADKLNIEQQVMYWVTCDDCGQRMGARENSWHGIERNATQTIKEEHGVTRHYCSDHVHVKCARCGRRQVRSLLGLTEAGWVNADHPYTELWEWTITGWSRDRGWVKTEEQVNADCGDYELVNTDGEILCPDCAKKAGAGHRRESHQAEWQKGEKDPRTWWVIPDTDKEQTE